MTKRKDRATKTGQGVDSSGGPVFDPSANVLQLVDAESLRQDGLRAKDAELREKDSAHFKELLALDRVHAAEIRDLETKRLDAIRAVDQGQIQRAAEVQATAALALQAQVVASAEAVRTQVANSNQQWTDNLATGLKPLADAIAALQVQQNRQAGQAIQVAESRDARAETRDVRGESRLNIGTLISAIVAVLAVIAYLTK